MRIVGDVHDRLDKNTWEACSGRGPVHLLDLLRKASVREHPLEDILVDQLGLAVSVAVLDPSGVVALDVAADPAIVEVDNEGGIVFPVCVFDLFRF